ncbi:uncharacterized protein JN550_013096 [Neoarthrinium moseri]|uniref:uncharacterized protein n=1 Tax=Neoarthrinium moseri TaxID=1658444 RepID=UPI001FDC12E5|nr:uncharacterized protein JN550_013096 [Neoarthrinium moseri]KAI1857760.1 hypothetical protein JN550_013096 [Neoarthrinium moseri]
MEDQYVGFPFDTRLDPDISDFDSSTDDEDNYQLEMTNAWILHDDTWAHIPYDYRTPENVPQPMKPQLLHQAHNGLSNLQLGHNHTICPVAMLWATRLLWSKMQPPEMAKDPQLSVFMMPPTGPEPWSQDRKIQNDFWHAESDEYRAKASVEICRGRIYIWPIFVVDDFGSDWVTLWWKQKEWSKEVAEADRHGCQGFVDCLAIIDPRLDSKWSSDAKPAASRFKERRDRIRLTLHEYLDDYGVYLGPEDSTLDKFIYIASMGDEENTSGERCYAAIKTLLNRLAEAYAVANDTKNKSKSDNTAYHATIESELSQITNPQDRVISPQLIRMEMTGLLAWSCLSHFDYNARIAIEHLPPGVKIPFQSTGGVELEYTPTDIGIRTEAKIAPPPPDTLTQLFQI